jgi:hypothetical protein
MGTASGVMFSYKKIGDLSTNTWRSPMSASYWYTDHQAPFRANIVDGYLLGCCGSDSPYEYVMGEHDASYRSLDANVDTL